MESLGLPTGQWVPKPEYAHLRKSNKRPIDAAGHWPLAFCQWSVVIFRERGKTGRRARGSRPLRAGAGLKQQKTERSARGLLSIADYGHGARTPHFFKRSPK